tara:strand:- start:553 stop:1002 length:450 start_codon:yes stop_codon:yes gene_type:complete
MPEQQEWEKTPRFPEALALHKSIYGGNGRAIAKKALVVENRSDVATFAGRACSKRGYSVVYASDIENARRKYENDKSIAFAVVDVDLGMNEHMNLAAEMANNGIIVVGHGRQSRQDVPNPVKRNYLRIGMDPRGLSSCIKGATKYKSSR